MWDTARMDVKRVVDVERVQPEACTSGTPVDKAPDPKLGYDVIPSARYFSPDFMKLVLSPRPTLGASINTAGDTSFLYTGLTWGGFVWKGLFIEGFFGLATHDGQLNSHDPEPHDRRQLGSRVLFREAIEIGYRFLDNHSVSIMLDTSS